MIIPEYIQPIAEALRLKPSFVRETLQAESTAPFRVFSSVVLLIEDPVFSYAVDAYIVELLSKINEDTLEIFGENHIRTVLVLLQTKAIEFLQAKAAAWQSFEVNEDFTLPPIVETPNEE